MSVAEKISLKKQLMEELALVRTSMENIIVSLPRNIELPKRASLNACSTEKHRVSASRKRKPVETNLSNGCCTSDTDAAPSKKISVVHAPERIQGNMIATSMLLCTGIDEVLNQMVKKCENHDQMRMQQEREILASKFQQEKEMIEAQIKLAEAAAEKQKSEHKMKIQQEREASRLTLQKIEDSAVMFNDLNKTLQELEESCHSKENALRRALCRALVRFESCLSVDGDDIFLARRQASSAVLAGAVRDFVAMDLGWKGLQRGLVFAVNGDRFELEKVDPSITQLEFLRTRRRYKGTKLGCGEDSFKGRFFNGLLVPMAGPILCALPLASVWALLLFGTAVSYVGLNFTSLNFYAVITTEGLGNAKDGFHSIHKRFSGFQASQCGFCTPGMCLSLFSALRNAEKKDRNTPPTGFSKLTTLEAQKAILGNLCRCTGYLPIVDVCESFAADVDLEDLGLNTFWKKGPKSARAEKLPFYRHSSFSTFPEFLKLEIKSAWAVNSALMDNRTNVNGTQMDMPSTILPASLAEGHWHCADNVGKVFELLNLNMGNGKLVKLVAGNTGTGVYKEGDFYDVFIYLRGIPELSVIRWDVEGIQIGATVTISRAIQVLKERKNLVFDKIVDHVSKVASEFIRNTATLGGNFILAQRNQLPSDIATILLAVDSTVDIWCIREAIRTRKVENLFVGKPVSLPILLNAIKLLKKVIIVKEGTAHRDYRVSLGAAFLFDFLHPICKGLIEKKGNEHLGLGNGASPEKLNGGVDVCLDKDDLVLSSKQLLEYGSWHSPIAEPTKKAGAELQAYGTSFILVSFFKSICNASVITKPLARINGISFKPTKASQKVIAVISVADIPKGGENVGAVNMHGMDPLFADSIALNVGQPLGLVIAESQKLANMGPKQAVVDYSTENLETPILSVEEAVQRSSLFELPPYLCPEQIGDFTKGMAEADHKILSAEIMLPSQYHFYMETQTVLAIPDEDNCLVVYSSTQFPEDTAILIAKCLGIPVLNVLVITRRVGGGFGGKATKAIPTVLEALRKYDWGASSFDVKLCKTNLPSKSVMRAPRDVQGSFIVEAVIEHVAFSLCVSANLIRQKKLHSFESLRLYCEGPMPGKVGIFRDGSVVIEVGGIELGQGLWTKVRQMAAFTLGQLWSHDILDLLEKLSANLQSVNLSASTLWIPELGCSKYVNYGAALSEVEIDLLTGGTTILQTDIIYDCGQSLNPAVDLGQIEGAFIQGIGFFMCEEYLSNTVGLVISDGTWAYKIPTVDTIPKKFNVEILNSGHHRYRVLSSNSCLSNCFPSRQASGEPPLLLAASVHCATREAIKAARTELLSSTASEESPLVFQLKVPATMPVVKELCGLDNLERYSEASLAAAQY
ncbi:hypothetical protein HPP92_013949 [Vanilla planifolia]|uniref:FAD-binding PCMH-type domain-containing protein n=1 Tax=Vanilla planifolia TaxID=51239 RepID=A0A835QZ84_VANPL|nr:hypothetical protein HPP92_013949 [Vanilla planifolia]